MRTGIVSCIAIFVSLFAMSIDSDADQLVLLKNGMEIRGNHTEIPTLDKNAFAGGKTSGASTVTMIDDGLRRVYVHRRGMVAAVRQLGPSDPPIEIWQPEAGGPTLGGLGQVYGVSPLTAYGRREIYVRGPKGDTEAITQGITSFDNRYVQLQSLPGRPSYQWDMRIATSTIDSDTWRRFFRRVFDQDDLEERLKAMRFFITAERYADARQELLRIRNDFPDQLDGLNLDENLTELIELEAMQFLKEAAIRRDAGQPELADGILARIPVTRLSRERRLEVSDAVNEAKQNAARVQAVLDSLSAQIARLPEPTAASLAGFVAELRRDLSPQTINRLSDYLRLGELQDLPLESRVALAISGWLMGGGAGVQNLKIAESLIEVRRLVGEYLGDTTAQRRQEILQILTGLEGSEPEYVAAMLPLIGPVRQYPETAVDPQVVGMMHWPSVDGTAEDVANEDPHAAFRYKIQLPPEYNPLRQYPCIVALPPEGRTAGQQLQWWAGDYEQKLEQRVGLASRFGYIVIAPTWNRPGQSRYEYTPIEHHRVLASLRHAMRRTAIDADRVFIAGHGEGATAAWDIAVSHPDHWAGLIAVGGEPDKTILHYDKNAKYLPKYFVLGEINGSPPPLARNGAVYEDYLGVDEDTMVVEYRGRGSEHFFEETPDLFQWMQLPSHRRAPIPTDLELATMRSGDNYFWWLELGKLNDAIVVNPILWDNVRRAGAIDAKVNAKNQIRVKAPANEFTLWFAPDMGIDLAEPVIVRYGSGNARKTFQFDGGLHTMLEDVRRRGDRRRPFWATLQVP